MGEVTPTLFSLITKFVEIRHQLKTREKNRPVYLTSLDDFDVPLEFVKCVCKVGKIGEMKFFIIFYFFEKPPKEFFFALNGNVLSECVDRFHIVWALFYIPNN